MKYFTNKNSMFRFFTIILIILGFSLFLNKANAQYVPTTISPLYNYYRQLCPSDFSLTLQSTNQYICFKLLGGNENIYNDNTYNNNPYNNAYYNNYLNYNSLPLNALYACKPGDIFSILTGQRCDGYDSTYYYNNDLRGDYSSIEKFSVRDGDDTELREGENDAEIMEIRFDVEDGDIRLNRIEFTFEYKGDTDAEDLPWNTFEEIRLLSDGREIDSISTDNKGDWQKENNDEYTVFFSNLNEIIRENDRANLTLEVDIDSNINNIDDGDISWDVFIPDRGLRAYNAKGNTLYEGDDDENVTIHIEE